MSSKGPSSPVRKGWVMMLMELDRHDTELLFQALMSAYGLFWLWQDFRSRRSSRCRGRPVRWVGSLPECPIELTRLLPHLADVEVVSLDDSGPTVVVRARTRSQVPVTCTGCGTPSGWCHSRYDRQLNDMSLGGRAVRIELSVRRLYCENADCGKVTFAEQVPGLTVRYQRRTPLLQHLVEAAGVLLAGRGGARMLRAVNVTRHCHVGELP
ncbi:transposase family protein [Streptomyces viridosporus]|uniref:transposase family protein n=1 Tax=Streptomyces viridosporus TaxID=67581 RepID=UPI0036FD4ACF